MKISPFLNRVILCCAVIMAFSQLTSAQEQLRVLDVNPVLLQYRTEHPASRIKSSSSDTLLLPFKDDFSGTSILPDNTLWEDENVYINSTYADSLPTIGMATFDVIGPDGLIYKDANETTFRADVLTSKPINLKSAKNVWLSFYFLPGGRGDAPSTNDSLILEFKVNNTWVPQWIAQNNKKNLRVLQYLKDTISYDTIRFTNNLNRFHLAMVPVKKAGFLKKDFQFRFRNSASMTGNEPGKLGMTDLWHVDYMYLDSGRNVTDTVYHDLAFYKPLTSLLTPYTSVPFHHFISSSSLIKSDLEYPIRNNHNQTLVAQKTIRYTELINGIPSPTPSVKPINKDGVDAHSFYTAHVTLDNPFITNRTQNITFEVKAYFEHLFNDKWEHNDAVTYIQKFEDYFSYDDGTSEAGYGINDMNGVVAYGFKIFETDTLTGVDIFFNSTKNAVNKNYYFKLAVWADNKGKPGTLLFKDPDSISRQPLELNKFQEYLIDPPIILNDRFYIGWYQVAENFLNVGYDLNTDNKSNVFYNTYGQWLQSGSGSSEILPGSLMLRPYFRNQKSTGIPSVKNKTVIRLFPNPADKYISISNESHTNPVNRIIICNLAGQITKEIVNPNTETIDLTSLSHGIYIVKIIFRDGTFQTVKLLKK